MSYAASSGLDLHPVRFDSMNVTNYSSRQASLPSQLPQMSASAFGPAFTPGYVNAPFATPYSIPFAAPELARQYTISGPLQIGYQPSNLRATDNFSCSMVTVDGLEKGEGCTVKKNGDPPVTVDLTGTNPFLFVNGGNQIGVVGDANSQMCVVNYSDAFDASSFQLRANGRFQTCI